MRNFNILIVEGNLREENKNFSEVGIQTHTESLMDSLKYFSHSLNFEVVNPSSDKNLDLVNSKLSSYDGLIWGGSSLNIYNDTPEIKRQIEFRKDKLIENRKVFKDEEEIKKHISFIKSEISVSNKEQRMLELKNWLDNIK